MHTFKGHWLAIVGLFLITFELQSLQCLPITPDTRHPQSAAQTLPPILQSIDSKAKLDGFNRALHERLQHTRANLRPLQARATQLQHRFDAFQRLPARRISPNSAATRTARNEVVQEAQRLRTAVERKLQGFDALDQHYRSMRTLLQSKRKNAGLPRAWFDRDTERQMELNERIYKNIIDLLVHLIECPVNIIHDVMGPPPQPSTPVPETDDGGQNGEDGETEGNTLYDEREPIELNADVSGVPWLEEFHY
ncbi:uncharacterized protein LOC126558899 [Anopheles maculipalpis]|uniref:uncharacterized protein LOC126558899 n=1 Tax=Anopheles maculipalpis TaxID=1496333 RepID=UPI0021593EA2|nr:uncharacterized protein LOC126558899 [Anopheles maculipalpis]